MKYVNCKVIADFEIRINAKLGQFWLCSRKKLLLNSRYTMSKGKEWEPVLIQAMGMF
jgi:hypothetical protein